LRESKGAPAITLNADAALAAAIKFRPPFLPLDANELSPAIVSADAETVVIIVSAVIADVNKSDTGELFSLLAAPAAI
jgi:hypothetical protein